MIIKKSDILIVLINIHSASSKDIFTTILQLSSIILLGIEKAKFAHSSIDRILQSLLPNSNIGNEFSAICISCIASSNKQILTDSGAKLMSHISLLSHCNCRDKVVSSLSNRILGTDVALISCSISVSSPKSREKSAPNLYWP